MADQKKYGTSQYHLLKAEAFCAELIANGVSFDDFILRFQGAFRKSYRNDIEQVVPAKDGSEQITITINRDGLYDKLPEGLFHQTRGGARTGGLSGMVGEYRRFRDEEKQARKFFQPIEQELFRYAVITEQEERKLQFGILNGNLEAEFYRFWNIEPSLPQKPASVLVLIMPWIAQIKGNRRLTAKALSMMLGKPVDSMLVIAEEQYDQKAGFRLGADALLGRDTVCGNHFAEPYEQWVFRIADLDGHEVEAYTEHNAYGRFLKRFEELFIPLEVEVKFEYHCQEATGEEAVSPVLGYGFYL
jgi:hypothetical protein